MTEKEYGQLVESMSPKSPKWRDCICAFVIGGLICTLGQFLMCFYDRWMDKEMAGTAASTTTRQSCLVSKCRSQRVHAEISLWQG